MRQQAKYSFLISIVLAAVLIFAFSTGLFAAEEISGNEILKKVDRKSEVVSQGEMLSILTFENENADGTTSNYKFGALARQKPDQPNRTLIYYLEPESVRGSIFLSRDTTQGATRMWLYLPALGQAKELSASKKESSFAGSTLSFEEIGSWAMSEEYNGQVIGEAAVEIGDKSVPAYKLKLTAKEGADPQYPTQTIWVAQNSWVLLRSKSFDAEGQLQKEMEVQDLTTFEGDTVTEKLVASVPDSGASTAVLYQKRERPEKDIPDSVFDPQNLSKFDPQEWGLAD